MLDDNYIQKPAVSQSQDYPASRSHQSVSGDKYTSYENKINVVNGALQEIGMGRYQWYVQFSRH